jgi:hypothetical protein
MRASAFGVSSLFTHISHNNHHHHHNNLQQQQHQSTLIYLSVILATVDYINHQASRPYNRTCNNQPTNTTHTSCLPANNLSSGLSLSLNKTEWTTTAMVASRPLLRLLQAVVACTTSSHRQKSPGAQDATERRASTSPPANPTWSNTGSTSTTALDALAWSDTTAAERHKP